MADTSSTTSKLAHVPLITLRDIQALAAVHSGSATHLFIHIPKNAGVSIRKSRDLRWKVVGVHRQFLRDRQYLHDLRVVMRNANEHHGIAHARLRDVKPWLATRLRPVAIVRNPWARTASRYRFSQMIARSGSSFASARLMEFEEFLDTRFEFGDAPFYWHRAARGWYPQRDYVVDHENKIAADLLRQEHLDTEAPAYFGLSDTVRRRNVTRDETTADWRRLYTPKTIQIIADWYADDIDTFGFDFDTSATRNSWSAARN